ncbi:MAG: septation protein IspZ [Burkholderiales bacterium]
MTTPSLWWSLLWRFTLLFLVLSFALFPLAQVLLVGIDEVKAIHMRPSVGWWLFAVLLWIAVAASPRFVSLVLWGERLHLTSAQWVLVCRGLALFFVALGIVNVLVAFSASTVTWVNFKLFWPYPLFAAFLMPLSIWVRKTNAAN